MEKEHLERIPLEQLLEDKEVRIWMNRIICSLIEYKRSFKNAEEQPIGIITVDYEAEGLGVITIDIGIQLLIQLSTSNICRIGTKVLGMEIEQEEVFIEISNDDLRILKNSGFEKILHLTPLAQEVYDRYLKAVENKSIFKMHEERLAKAK